MESFPFPCTIEFGGLELELGRKCLVLQRKGRKFPHITLFYDKKPGTNYWWPHITRWSERFWRHGAERHEELAKLLPRHGYELQRRFERLLMAWNKKFLASTDLETLQEGGWIILRPTLDVLEALLGAMRVGPTTLSLEKLADRLQDEEFALELLCRCAVEPMQLVNYRPASALAALRITKDGLERVNLYGVERPCGNLAWYMAPVDILGLDTEPAETAEPGGA